MKDHHLSSSKEVDEKSPAHLVSPIPFYPGIHKQVQSIQAAVLLAYLEIHHPAPQDLTNQASQRVSSLPVKVDCDAVAADLGVSRRTLRLALSHISVWMRDEKERARRSRASREFIQPTHNQHGKIKPYSVVGPVSEHGPAVLTIRRNLTLLRYWFALTNFQVAPALDVVRTKVFTAKDFAADRPFTAPFVSGILSRSVLSGDRRSSRQERGRLAVERGLSPEMEARMVKSSQKRSR